MSTLRSEPLSVAVWGSGPWTSYTLGVLKTLGLKRLFVGGDPNNPERKERLSTLARKHGAVSLSAKELLDHGCQAVILALPPTENLSCARAFLQGGLDVFVQKPLAGNFAAAEEMLEIARCENRIIMGGSDARFRPDVVEARKLIQRGDIGRPSYVHARFGSVLEPNGWRTDLLEDLGEHAISVVHELLGPSTTLKAERQNSSSGQLYFSGESWSAVARLSWQSPKGFAPEIVVEGSEGTLLLNTSTVDQFRAANRPGLDKLWRWPALQRRLSTSHKRIKCVGPHSYAQKLSEFFDAVQTRKPRRSFAEDLNNFRLARKAIEELPDGRESQGCRESVRD